ASINSSSEHPLAQATLRFAEEKNIHPSEVSAFEAVTGKGVTGTLNGKHLALGNDKLMEQAGASIPSEVLDQVSREQQKGKTVSYLAEGPSVIGYVVISDKIKETSKKAIEALQREGVQVFMFTGDNENTARSVSESLGLDGFKAQMLPQDKLNEVRKLQEQ